MLDNRNSGLDPSFVDKAWEDMRRQLDVAMPVESKKRRPVLAWWWWAAALLLPIMIGIGLYPQPQAPELEALPIPGQSRAIAGPDSTIPQKQNAPIEETDNGDKAIQSSTNSFLKNPVISKLNSTPLLPKTPQRTDQQATKSIVEAKPQLPVTDVREPETNPVKTSNAPKTVSNSSDVASNRQLLPIIDVLPTGSPLPLPKNDLLFEKEATASPVSSRYAIEMGTSTRSFLTLDGFFVGINKEWQKIGSRWSFGLGVHYRQQLIPFQTTNLLKVNSGRSADQLESPVQEETLNGSFEYVDFASGVVGFASGDSAINVPISSLNLIQRLHYIDIPTYANFKMGRKWEAFASVRFSFLAKAHLDHTDRPVSRTTQEFALNSGGWNNGQFGNSPLASYANRLASNTRLGTNTGDFHSFMLSGAMGITYYSSPQVGWRLQYSSTPVSLYNIGSINMRDHWLGTSLIWRFGGK